MKTYYKNFSTLLFFAFLTFGLSYGQVSLTPDKKDGIYRTGETALWTIELQAGTLVDSIGYTLKKGGLTLQKKGFLYPKNKKASISYYFNEPGAVLLNINWKNENKEEQTLIGGAIASPEEITLSAKRPDDFDSFWESQIESLKKIPKNTRLKKESSTVKGVDYYKTTMNNIKGTHIQGQLARPSKGKSLPALLIVQWAGIYPLQKEWVLDMAKKGWLVLNISAHDLPIDEADSFYKDQSNGPLKDYPSIGNDDKNTSYFLRMYLSCYRAAEYLTERKDWNGETLVVMGGSQGGLQSLMTAGLHPKITAALALVPAGFDMQGPVVGRKGGWPQWYDAFEDNDPLKVRETSRYFDVANFVPHIKCPVLVGIGLLDEVCPPEGIYAGMNQLNVNKEIILLPNSGHQNKDDSQQPYYQRMGNDWLPALMEGVRIPEKK
jgi:cephalosporin-C deacetylase-like acetyl esterase